MNWKKAKGAAYRALRNCLALEDEAFLRGADDDLKALATRMVDYWRESHSGNVLTGNLLDTAIHRSRILCSTLGVNGRGKALRIERVIKTFALVGSELIEAFDNGGTDGEAEE